MTLPPLLLFFTLLFLALSAFFSASETALFSIPSERKRYFEKNKKNAHQWVFLLLQNGQRTLLLILLANIFINVTVAGLIASLLDKMFPAGSTLFKLFIATAIIVLLGEVVPKNMALRRNEAFALTVAPLLYHLSLLFAPVLQLVQKLNNFFLRHFKEHLRRPSPFVTVDELKVGVDKSMREGALSDQERELIHAVLDKGQQPVRKLMVHRSYLPVFPDNMFADVAKEKMISQKNSMAIVRSDRDPETIIGIVKLHTIINAAPQNRLCSLCFTPVWVPESMDAADVISLLISEKHIEACVIDEFGCFSGVFFLTEVLGDLFSDLASPPVEQKMDIVTGTSRVLNGLQDIDESGDWIPPALKNKTKEFRTINGILTNFLGRIPRAGESFAIEGYNFYIISAGPTKIESVLIRKGRDL